MLSGMTVPMTVCGRSITFFNQRHPGWTHPYPYTGDETLHSSGCGIFALCHCAQWLTGCVPDPAQVADFPVKHGGRGDDGTDRPALLAAAQASGLARKLGFAYSGDGLRNDIDTLYAFLLQEQGVSMANIRAGHIVSLVGAREADGLRQVLVIDSFAESLDERVSFGVKEVLDETAITFHQADALRYGHAAYWAELTMVRDFNLLFKVV